MSDLEKLQGTWEVRAVFHGTRVSDHLEDGLFQFEGDKVVIGHEEAAWDYSVSLLTTVEPRHIDIVGNHGEADSYRKRVYRLLGENLVICLNDEDRTERPSRLEATAANQAWLFILKRTTERRIE